MPKNSQCVLSRAKRCGGLCESGAAIAFATACPWCAVAVGAVVVLAFAGYVAYSLYKQSQLNSEIADLKASVDMLQVHLNDTIKYSIATQRYRTNREKVTPSVRITQSISEKTVLHTFGSTYLTGKQNCS